jgi:hypothetical protein
MDSALLIDSAGLTGSVALADRTASPSPAPAHAESSQALEAAAIATPERLGATRRQGSMPDDGLAGARFDSSRMSSDRVLPSPPPAARDYSYINLFHRTSTYSVS